MKVYSVRIVQKNKPKKQPEPNILHKVMFWIGAKFNSNEQKILSAKLVNKMANRECPEMILGQVGQKRFQKNV